MDKQREEILEGLKTAIEAEMTGHEFYKNAAENTKDPKGKETFLEMAAEEMGHLNYLRHQYKSIVENGDYDFSREFNRTHPKHADSPIFSDEIRNRLKDSHFEMSALTIGLKLELDAVNFYRSCAEKAHSVDARRLYNELSEWEQDHYLAFERQLEMLREEFFRANDFAPW